MSPHPQKEVEERDVQTCLFSSAIPQEPKETFEVMSLFIKVEEELHPTKFLLLLSLNAVSY